MNTLPETEAEWLDRQAVEFYRRRFAACSQAQQDNLLRAAKGRGLDLVDYFKTYPIFEFAGEQRSPVKVPNRNHNSIRLCPLPQ